MSGDNPTWADPWTPFSDAARKVQQDKAKGRAVSKVLAKFLVAGLESQRNAVYDDDPETGRYVQTGAAEACVVKLVPVQGEPFGKATPSGSIQMSILNPAAARIFREAWQAYVYSDDPAAKAPEFYVTFKLDDGTGSD